MAGQGHRLDTEARGIPAALATRTLVTQPWTASRTKARNERKAKAAMLDRAGLGSDIVYIAKPVVPKTEPRKRYRKASPVTVTFQAPRPKAPVHWTAEHNYTEG
jgi:hypothetical protein